MTLAWACPARKKFWHSGLSMYPWFNKEVSRKHPPQHLHAPRADAASMKCSPTSGKAKTGLTIVQGRIAEGFADKALI
jgi:hypothetical protein